MKGILTFSNILFLIFFLIVIVTLSPLIAISLGLVYSFIYSDYSQSISSRINTIPLQIGIVLLGFSISLTTLIPIISSYAWWILFFIIFSYILSFALGNIFKIDLKLNILLASGLSICGATAIALIGPLIKSSNKFIFTSLAILFLFNTIAIILFPFAGKLLDMSNHEFGIFSALAIHDTGSVIGSSLSFSNSSVEIAASLKILRTLGLIPLILLLNYKLNNVQQTFTFPRFIIYFFIALTITNTFDISYSLIEYLKVLSKSFIIFGIFCIGLQSSKIKFKELSYKPLILATIVWITVIPIAYIISIS
jgi:uncharacterized integral membrane protein (TIGR00698 family)